MHEYDVYARSGAAHDGPWTYQDTLEAPDHRAAAKRHVIGHWDGGTHAVLVTGPTAEDGPAQAHEYRVTVELEEVEGRE